MRSALGRTAVYCRIAGHLTVAAIKVGLCFRSWPEGRRRGEISAWSAQVLDIFGIGAVAKGRPPDPGRPHLIVANHVSWLDVYCILSRTGAAFVAKTEVRAWPVIGSLAAGLDTIFVSRGRYRLGVEVNTISVRLAAGGSICVFPEGTSSDGSSVLQFRAACFEAAIAAGIPVQPVAIRYLRADGTRAEEAVFTGDTTLVMSFGRLAAASGMTAEVTFLEPIESRGTTRRDLARRAESAIRAVVEASGSDAVLSRAA